MAVLTISFEFNNQVITRTDDITLAADSMNTINAQFDLDEVWDGYEGYYCRFIRWDGSQVFDVPLAGFEAEAPKDGHIYLTCTVPHEVIKHEGFYFAVFAVNGEEKMFTSVRTWVNVAPSGDFETTTPLPSTPDLLTQFYAWVQSCIDIAQGVRDDADAGVFDGAPFTIAKTYPTVGDLEADVNSDDVQQGEYGLVAAESLEDPDNGRLYRKDQSEEGVYSWTYITYLVGVAGKAATISGVTAAEGEPWSAPTVNNSGSQSNAVFNFTLPGTPDFAIGTVSTLPAGSSATATVEKDEESGTVKVSFGIPKGDTGSAANVQPISDEDIISYWG